MIKLLVSTAMVAASPTAFVAPANAVTASPTTVTRMATTCAALVDASATLHDGSPVWSTAVINVVDSEQPGVNTDTEVPNTRVGTGTPIYSDTKIAQGTVGPDRPYRIGGSVNMFGDQVATTKTFPGYTFKFDRSTSTTTNYTIDCQLTQSTEVLQPAVDTPGHKVEGHYVNCDFGHGQGSDNGGEDVCADVPPTQASCIAHNATGDSLPFWGLDTEQCKFIKTADAVPPGHTDAYYTDGPDIVTTSPGHTDSQTDVTSQSGLDGVSNSPLVLHGSFLAGQVVICISPE